MRKLRIMICAPMLFSFAIKLTAQKKNTPLPSFSFPDFLHAEIKVNGDTSWSYEFYDKDLHPIALSALKDVSEIEQVKYYKVYQRSDDEVGDTYRPKLFDLVCRYVQVDTNIWVRVDPSTRTMQRYHMRTNILVRKDTIKLVDPVTLEQRSVVYKYFKTEAIKSETDGHSSR
jgi:hypothetical protein